MRQEYLTHKKHLIIKSVLFMTLKMELYHDYNSFIIPRNPCDVPINPQDLHIVRKCSEVSKDLEKAGN